MARSFRTETQKGGAAGMRKFTAISLSLALILAQTSFTYAEEQGQRNSGATQSTTNWLQGRLSSEGWGRFDTSQFDVMIPSNSMSQ